MRAVLADGVVRGIFDIVDPNFGNLWTNIPQSLFTEAGFVYGDTLNMAVRHAGEVVFQEKVPHYQSFGFVPKGDYVIYTNELMKVSLAVSQGSFIERSGLSYGADWEIEFSK